jgi:hypothetical protein
MTNTASVHNVTFGSTFQSETDFTFFSDNVPELARDMLLSLEEKINQIR